MHAPRLHLGREEVKQHEPATRHRQVLSAQRRRRTTHSSAYPVQRKSVLGQVPPVRRRTHSRTSLRYGPPIPSRRRVYPYPLRTRRIPSIPHPGNRRRSANHRPPERIPSRSQGLPLAHGEQRKRTVRPNKSLAILADYTKEHDHDTSKQDCTSKHGNRHA